MLPPPFFGGMSTAKIGLMRLLLSIVLAIPLSAAAVDGAKVHWTGTGTAKQAVILVHGWTCDESSWDAQVPVLSQKYRVITLDLPGHGKSDPPKDGKFSMIGFARAVEAVRAEAKVDKVVLVGHSMGTPVIREYARLYPKHVVGLVPVDGLLSISDRWAASGQRPGGAESGGDDRTRGHEGARGYDPGNVYSRDTGRRPAARVKDDAGSAGIDCFRSHDRNVRYGEPE